jgi:hypothetical protein
MEQHSIGLPDYNDIRALYYDENVDYPAQSRVIIFFDKKDGNIDVATLQLSDFSGGSLTPGYLSNYTVTLKNTDIEHCYYTGDGFVIREHNGESVRYDKQGNVKATLPSKENGKDMVETYSFNAKTRYIFSEQYMRLMKAHVWW